MRQIYFFSLIFLFPSSAQAYIDPNIFTVIWQVLAAFLFSAVAYSKILYNQTKYYVKNISTFFSRINIFFINEFLIIILVLFLPVLLVLSKENNFFDKQTILFTFIFQFFLLLILFLFLNFFFKKFKTSFFASAIIFLIFQLYGFLEGLIITTFLTAENLKYFRIISLLFFISIAFIFLRLFYKLDLDKLKLQFTIFLVILTTIIIINNNINKSPKKFNNKLWSYETPNLSKIKYDQNVYILIADSYISEFYYSIIYEKKNKLYSFLKDKKFNIKTNTLSNYSNTILSLPSFYNSNYFNNINKETFKDTYSLLDNSYLIKNLMKNNYEHKLIKCYFDYIKKRKFCKKLDRFYKINEDINLIQTIYYYNSFYSLFRLITKKILLNFKTTEDNFKDTINNDISRLISTNKNKTFSTIIFNIPHAPYTVDQSCNWKNVPSEEVTVNNYLIKDHDTRVNGYLDNLSCINNIIIETINEIEFRDKNALIILMSDNGPVLRPNKLRENENFKLNEKDKLALDYNSSIFAIGGNFKCKELIDKINLINTFRIIFNCNSGRNDMLLPNNIFVSEMNKIFETSLYYEDK
jgi:hypothetical protein